MNTIFKTGIVLTVFLFAIASVSFALTLVTTLQDASYNSVATYDLDTDGDATNDSDTLIVDLQAGVFWSTTWSQWQCFCTTPDQAATVTSTVGDSVTVALPVYSQSSSTTDKTVADKFRNATAIVIKLATSASPDTGDSVLEVVSTDTITAQAVIDCGARGSGIQYSTDTATLSAIASTGEILLTKESDFSAATANFTPDTDKIYVQVTDADQNTKAYAPADTVSVTLTTLAGDSETVELTEIDVNDTVFRYTTGMSITSDVVSVGDGALQVKPVGDTITATYTDGTKTATGVSVFDNFNVSASSPQTAGTAFTVTITARNSSGATLTGYTGPATLSTDYVSPASGTSAITPTAVPTFTDGIATINVTYADAGTITITATDDADSNLTGTSGNILVLPENFLVESSGTGLLNQIVNKAFNLRVTARNSSNVTTPNYNRTVNLTVSNVTPTDTTPTISPTSITGSSFSSGIYTASMTYDKWGTAKITATDEGYSAATGKTSSAINFYPNSFSITAATPPAARSAFYLDEEFDVTVTALDYNDATITNYGGTVTFTDVDDIDLPDDYQFLSGSDNGSKAFTISGTEEKSFTLDVEDASYSDATGTSDSISLMYGKIQVNDVAGPIGTLSTTVEIVDSNGNIIADDDSTTFIVTLLESKANSTATVVTDATVSAGKATISVTDTELEKVTVTPDSTPYLEPESGEVEFSETAVGGGGARRIGSGTRILYWRELREDEK